MTKRSQRCATFFALFSLFIPVARELFEQGVNAVAEFVRHKINSRNFENEYLQIAYCPADKINCDHRDQHGRYG